MTAATTSHHSSSTRHRHRYGSYNGGYHPSYESEGRGHFPQAGRSDPAGKRDQNQEMSYCGEDQDAQSSQRPRARRQPVDPEEYDNGYHHDRGFNDYGGPRRKKVMDAPEGADDASFEGDDRSMSSAGSTRHAANGFHGFHDTNGISKPSNGFSPERRHEDSSPDATPRSSPNRGASALPSSPPRDESREASSVQGSHASSHQPSRALSRSQDEEDEEEDGSQAIAADDAILDLAELEQLQEEAERMKGLGNKHMAAQEYTRAYNAYSAALQLSPVGPSSHVFLSNRAASLLSLKRYSAAAVDARRAVALAPTFGKAHARLGQALYFLKQYRGAVEAYEDALKHEDEEGSNSAVTRAYLLKAQEKLARQEEKERRRKAKDGSEEMSVMEESVNHTVAYSVATDKQRVGLASGLRTNNDRVNAVAKAASTTADRPSKAFEEKATLSSTVNTPVEKAKDEDLPEEDLRGLNLEDKNDTSDGDMGSPFLTFHKPENRSSPTFMTVETGPMGGPAQRRVEPPTLPEHRVGFTTTTNPSLGINTPSTLGATPTSKNAMSTLTSTPMTDEPDPDFDEALRLQRRATHFLSHKQYRLAVDEFSAALFLVPDDPILTPQLHVGRAHALNGQERFMSAKNDALMALKHILRSGEEDGSAAEAYSVLGKSLYYGKDFQGCMEALEECERILKKIGGRLNVFDEAYLEQSREALDAGLGTEDGMSVMGSVRSGGSGRSGRGGMSVVSSVKEGKVISNIPKLKPPRFVSREQALQMPPNLPPTPKSWPQQSPTSPSSVSTGPERTIVFLSDAMGIKLNRGTDGLIRVLSVAKLPPGSPILRKGKIEAGDLVREAGGVDLRRPITATMWGDTVALIKMAPRPISIVVAKELTPEMLSKAQPNGRRKQKSPHIYAGRTRFEFPSPVIGDGSVEEFMSALGTEVLSNERDWEDMIRDMGVELPSPAGGEEAVGDSPLDEVSSNMSPFDPQKYENDSIVEPCEAAAGESVSEGASGEQSSETKPDGQDDSPQISPIVSSGNELVPTHETLSAPPAPDEIDNPSNLEGDSSSQSSTVVALDREILFDDSIISVQPLDDGSQRARQKVQGWTNQRWISASDRVLSFYGKVARLVPGRFFFSSDTYVPRTLAIYRNPDLILILRMPNDVDEIRRLLPIQDGLDLSTYGSAASLLESFLVAESVIDTKTCKLRLSQLTTTTSVPSKELLQNQGRGRRVSISKRYDPRRRSCFEILTPSEAVLLSAVVPSEDKGVESFKDIPEGEFTNEKAHRDTSNVEGAVSHALFAAHTLSDNSKDDTDQAWKHQVVLGTLHSSVISGNDQTLKEALTSALLFQKSKLKGSEGKELEKLDGDIIDARDEGGKTALHYACSRRCNATVNILVNSGANCWLPTISDAKTPCHICAESLDERSLSVVLSATYPSRPDPNALDARGRTPMYLAAVEGKGVDGNSNAITMGLCLSALEAWGGQLTFLEGDNPESAKLLHPIHCVSAEWKSAELSVILSHCNYYYPLTHPDGSDPGGISLGALFHYPLHAAMMSLRKQIFMAFGETGGSAFNVDFMSSEPALVKTLRILLEHGFEPNERFEGIVGSGDDIKRLSEFFGFTPLQILALAAKEARLIDLQKQETGEDDFDTMRILRNIMEVVQASADLLLTNGARTNVPPPPSTRLDRDTPPGCFSLKDALESRKQSMLPSVDREQEKIDNDDEVLTLLGGADRVKQSQNSFSMMVKSVKSTGALKIQKELYSAMDSNAPGGSDSNSCAVCWSEFGVMTNRKQFCQVSSRYVCNDCSTKRLDEKGSEYRISDGQFLLGKVEAGKANTDARAKQEEESRNRRARAARARASIRLKSTQSGAVKSASGNYSIGDTSSTISSLSQTRNAIIDRGDKLQSLADKSDALNAASLDFAKMAKELNETQGSFW